MGELYTAPLKPAPVCRVHAPGSRCMWWRNLLHDDVAHLAVCADLVEPQRHLRTRQLLIVYGLVKLGCALVCVVTIAERLGASKLFEVRLHNEAFTRMRLVRPVHFS